VRYNLSKALRILGRPGEAQLLANAVYEQTTDKELQDDAAFLLSQCAEDLGNLDDARNHLRTLMRRWPRSVLIPEAQKRINDLTIKAWRRTHEKQG